MSCGRRLSPREPMCASSKLVRPRPGLRRLALLTAGGYTTGMKTAVSIPDELFRRADELASRLGKSRSQLYREALNDYLTRRDPQAITIALNELADELGDDHAGFVAGAARQTLARNEW